MSQVLVPHPGNTDGEVFMRLLFFIIIYFQVSLFKTSYLKLGRIHQLAIAFAVKIKRFFYDIIYTFNNFSSTSVAETHFPCIL